MAKIKTTQTMGHSIGCWTWDKDKGTEWVLDHCDTLNRDRLHRKTSHPVQRFVIWKCNCYTCPAQLIALESEVDQILGISTYKRR